MNFLVTIFPFMHVSQELCTLLLLVGLGLCILAHAALLVSHSVTVFIEAWVCAQMTFVVGQSFLSMMCSMRVRSYASFCFCMAQP